MQILQFQAVVILNIALHLCHCSDDQLGDLGFMNHRHISYDFLRRETLQESSKNYYGERGLHSINRTFVNGIKSSEEIPILHQSMMRVDSVLLQTKIVLECRSPETYLKEFDDTESALFQQYTTNIVSSIRRSFEKESVELNKIQIVSLRRGSVITTLVLDTSTNTTMNSSDIQSTVASTVASAFNGSVNITTLNITTATVSTLSSLLSQSSTGVTSTMAPFTSGSPAQLGEYVTQVNIVCRFNDPYIAAYNVTNSPAYQTYTGNIKSSYLASSAFTGLLRFIDITFNSLSSGSVVADMQMVVASSSSNTNAITSAVVSATNQTFPSSSIVSLNVNILALIVTTPIPMSTAAPKFPEWASALLAIAGIGCVLLLIIIVTAIVIRLRSRDDKLIKYVHRDGNVDHATIGYVNAGLELGTTRGYDAPGAKTIKETKT